MSFSLPYFIFLTYTIYILIVPAVLQSVVNDAKIDGKELKCLVCDASLLELTKAVKQLDPSKTVDIGGHRLDADGNYRRKAISQTKSEMYLAEVMDDVCKKMDDYVRGIWKSNGTLTLFKMVTDDGKMNPTMSEVNIVQDEDLNKSVKYICQSIISEYEESLVKYYQDEEVDLFQKFCVEESNICDHKKGGSVNEEL